MSAPEVIVGKRQLWIALRAIEAGRSFVDTERTSGIPRKQLEQALVEAMARQQMLREHIQSRSGVTSLLRYPDRGPWGTAKYCGNCTGFLVADLLDYFKPQSVFDPMEGSGTTGEVCFDMGVEYVGTDLRSGFDLLSSPLPDRQFDLVFWHPPYWPGFRYSDHPNDFSNVKNVEEFLRRLREGFGRLVGLLTDHGHFVIVIGDGRKNGVFYPLHATIMQWGLLPLEAVLIKEGDHNRQARHFRYGPTRFIPILHEYVLIFKRGAT